MHAALIAALLTTSTSPARAVSVPGAPYAMTLPAGFTLDPRSLVRLDNLHQARFTRVSGNQRIEVTVSVLRAPEVARMTPLQQRRHMDASLQETLRWAPTTRAVSVRDGVRYGSLVGREIVLAKTEINELRSMRAFAPTDRSFWFLAFQGPYFVMQKIDFNTDNAEAARGVYTTALTSFKLK